jgi:hypothetical protein
MAGVSRKFRADLRDFYCETFILELLEVKAAVRSDRSKALLQFSDLRASG